MVLDNFVEVTIDEKKYKLCLNNKSIFQAERELEDKKLLVALANPPLSMGDLFTLFKWSLIGGGNKFTEDEYFSLFISLNSAIGAISLFNIIIEVVSKSGIIGKNPQAAQA